MITSITQDDELRRRLLGAVVVHAKPQWRDVRRRARPLEAPSLRRRRLLLAMAAVAILVAAPAFAIATGVIDFSSSPAAPEPVKVLFNQLAKMSGPNFPAPITGETRLVYTFHSADASYDLAVAPASGGGWCWAIVGREGHVQHEGRRPELRLQPAAAGGERAAPHRRLDRSRRSHARHDQVRGRQHTQPAVRAGLRSNWRRLLPLRDPARPLERRNSAPRRSPRTTPTA